MPLLLLADGGEHVRISPKALSRCSLLREMGEDGAVEEDDLIPLPNNVTRRALLRILEFLTPKRKHAPFSLGDATELMEVVRTADFLGCEEMLVLCGRRIIEHASRLTPLEFRGAYGIAHDFTADEERRFQAENPWCM